MLTSIRNIEESLSKLRRVKKSSDAGQSGPSDEDKIREQLHLDVLEWGKLVCPWLSFGFFAVSQSHPDLSAWILLSADLRTFDSCHIAPGIQRSFGHR
jgi:hypothetical protein